MITFVIIVVAASIVLVSAQISCYLSHEAAKRGEASHAPVSVAKATCC